MYRKTYILLLVALLMLTASLWSEESTERLAREKGVDAATLWNQEKYTESAQACEEAIAMLGKAVKEDGIPEDPAVISHWLYIAFDCYAKTSDLEQALRILNDILKLDPGNMTLYDQKALLQKKMSLFDDAIVTYTYIDSVKPSYKNCNKIGDIYKDREDWEKALEWYTKSYDLRNDSGTINNIAVINLNLGRKEAAIQAYQDFLATDPPPAAQIKTYKNLGKLYEDLKKMNEALENYEKSNALRYDNQLTLLLISRYYDLKQYDKSMEKIKLYLQNKPDSADGLYYRAMIKFDRGDLQGAKADFGAIQNNPTYGSIAKGYIDSINSQ